MPPCPIFATSFCRKGGKPPTPLAAGCPIFATFLFLSLRWETTNLNSPVSPPRNAAVPHLCDFFLSQGWETTNSPCRRVPHLRDVLVFVAKVGDHEPQFASLTPQKCRRAPSLRLLSVARVGNHQLPLPPGAPSSRRSCFCP